MTKVYVNKNGEEVRYKTDDDYCKVDTMIRRGGASDRILCRCNVCDIGFVATGKFNKTCPKCKEKLASMYE